MSNEDFRDDLRELARRLAGDVAGGGVLAPGPGHSRHDRSLRIFLDPDADGGFRVTSFAGDPWDACRDHVRHLLGMERWRPGAAASVHKPLTVRRPPQDAFNRARALDIVATSIPVACTLAELYLAGRIGRMIEWPADLRFHPRCPRGDQKLPALVALLRDIYTDQPKAIQRVFLQHDGSDRLRDQMGKATLGHSSGAVCKLVPDDTVTNGLGICEGVEKSLSLISIGWRPIWATCGTSTMSRFPLLAGIESLTIFADADSAGQRAATACARRYAEAQRQVKIVTPKSGDWSDAVIAA